MTAVIEQPDNHGDRTGRHFWNYRWNHQTGRRFGGRSYFYRKFSAELRRHAGAGATACEVGCGASVWLPFLASHDVSVSGLDYSDRGLELAEMLLRRANVQGRLIKGDLFTSNELPEQAFDLVFSLGLVEHFDRPTEVIERMGRLVRPGGVLLTAVPNLAGLWGRMQRRLDKDLFDAHVVYTPATLDEVHRQAGFDAVKPACYFGGFGALIVNYEPVLRRVPTAAGRALLGSLWLLQQAVSACQAPFPGAECRTTSAYVLGGYKRTAEAGDRLR